jgi:hypothetical protein
MQLWYTPDLRPHNIDSISTMAVSINPMILVPPGVRRWFLTRQCVLDVRDQETGELAELHLTGVAYHAHLLGREMYAEYWPAGEEDPIDLASAPVWHFDDQSQRNIINWNISLRTGDRLQTTCVMDSSGRSASTQFNEETTDEMCWAKFAGWPSTTNGVDGSCTGSVWSGILAPQEPGFGISARHPEAQARNVWDGTSLVTAGSALRLQGRPPFVIDGCTDSARFCGNLIPVLANDPNFTCSGPLSGLQRVQDMPNFGDRDMMSSSALELCCATSCQLLCDDPVCQTGDTSASEIPEPEELGPEAWADLRVRSMVSCGDGAAMVCSGAGGTGDDVKEMSSTSRMGDSSGMHLVTWSWLALIKLAQWA